MKRAAFCLLVLGTVFLLLALGHQDLPPEAVSAVEFAYHPSQVATETMYFPLIVAGTTPSLPTPTATVTLTPSPTPTSYRVADVSITVDDSADPVTSGQTFQYIVAYENYGPRLTLGGGVGGELSPSEVVTFTGAYTYTATGYQRYRCTVDESRFGCQIWPAILPGDHGTFYLDVVVNNPASEVQVRLCAQIWPNFAPMGGHDPNPDNNHDCEDTTIRALPFTPLLPLAARQKDTHTVPAPTLSATPTAASTGLAGATPGLAITLTSPIVWHCPGILCTLEWIPVCGEDGRTYSNPCWAWCSGGARTACYGPCPCPTAMPTVTPRLSTPTLLPPQGQGDR